MTKNYPKVAYYFSKISLSACLMLALHSPTFAIDNSINTNLNNSAITPPPNQHAEQTAAILPYSAEYKISSNSLSTNATRTLSKQGDNWLLSQHAKLLFIKVKEESLIENSAEGIRPLHYEYENNMSSKQDQFINFDWSTHSASDSKYRKPWSSDISDDTFDQLSGQLKMREAIINNRLKDEMSLTVVNRGKHKTYTVKELGEETISSEAGKLRTVKLLRSRAGSSSETTIWLAKDWNYIIVKLEQREDDEVYKLDLIKATLDGNTVKGL
ncbi:Uncharacterised protein [Zhongshania aliphaticivorans]|uniref:DUF3108 domain-containing protein n=1 Tax=Zhongshania aliphaticivorans TaxID=1470434 RepID=A0A5S9N2D1_9GAMM|nr:DUF3108 domain-containing protein [Zhongshania aliphaticivorans]CAA0082858.1 Uncharacterised protein [Zhongshania aliphaticivorans]CAA0083869.1 Uncharacterised protein [Zhongshania aliphaticivorans]